MFLIVFFTNYLLTCRIHWTCLKGSIYIFIIIIHSSKPIQLFNFVTRQMFRPPCGHIHNLKSYDYLNNELTTINDNIS